MIDIDNKQRLFRPQEITLLIVSILSMMAGAIITPALTEIKLEFHGDDEIFILLILTLPGLTTALFSPLFGILIDKYGRIRILVFCLFLYGVSGSSGFIFNQLNFILLGRAFLGISVGGIMTICSTLIGDYYNGRLRDKMIGLQYGLMTFSNFIFLILGGILADFTWRLNFITYLISFLLIPFVLMYLPEINVESLFNSKNFEIISFKRNIKTIIYSYSLGFLVTSSLYFIYIQIPFYLNSKFQSTPGEIGIALSVLALSSAVVSITYRNISSKFHSNFVFCLSFIILGLGNLGLSFITDYNLIIACLFIFGIGLGLFVPTIMKYLFTAIQREHRGKVISGYTTIIFLATFLSPIISNPIVKFYGILQLFAISGYIMVAVSLIYFFSIIQINKKGLFNIKSFKKN